MARLELHSELFMRIIQFSRFQCEVLRNKRTILTSHTIRHPGTETLLVAFIALVGLTADCRLEDVVMAHQGEKI